MTTLDLGPAFTRIVDPGNFLTYAGKYGTCVIYAPESIYSSKNAFKLDTTSTTTIDYTRGTINLKYKTEWQKEATQVTIDDENIENSKIVITLRGKTSPTTPVTDYVSNVTSLLPTGTLTGTNADLVKVFIDGTELTGLVKEVGTATTSTNASTGANDILQTITLSNFEEEVRSAGYYKEWSGNISLQLARGTLKDMYGSYIQTDASGNVVNDANGNPVVVTNVPGNGNMDAMDDTGEWIDIKVADTEASTSNAANKLFADIIKPEITYLSSEHTIGSGPTGNETVTVVFYVADKYFNSSSLTAENLIIKVDGEEPAWKTKTEDVNGNGVLDLGEGTKDTNGDGVLTPSEDLNGNGVLDTEIPYRTLTSEDIKGTVNGVENTVIGKKYTLTITGLDQGEAYDYSGLVTIEIPPDKITDKSNNANERTIFTIGLDENDGNENESISGGTVVDVVDPVWELVSSSVDTGAIVVRGKDKYFASSSFDENSLTVYANGGASATIEKDVTLLRYIKITEDASGNEVITQVATAEEADGVEYTIQLSNVTVDNPGYIGFVPTNASDLILDADGKAYYREENGGEISIEIAAGTLTDESTNISNMQRFYIGSMDAIKPEIYDIQKTQDASGKKVTFVFNVTDRNFYNDDEIEADEMTFWIDGTQTDKLTVDSFTYKEINAEIDSTTRVLGHQYTLVLSGFEETLSDWVTSGRKYRELSGTLEVKINADAARDTNLNTLNTDTTTLKQFVDFLKPELRYTHQGVDISQENKTYTMTFEVTDKYYTSGILSKDDLTITMQNGQVDANGDAIVYDLKQEETEGNVVITLNEEKIEVSSMNKTTDVANCTFGTVTNQLVGHKYTLTISNLEQLEIATGLTTADYSGIVSVKVAKEKVVDVKDNKNIEQTIVSGVNIPGGSGTGIVIDVVDPIWEKVSVSAYADPADSANSTATIRVRGTDTYFNPDDTDASTLTSDEIEIYINGTKNTTIVPTITEVQKLYEDRVENGTTVEDVQYGIIYDISFTGFAGDVSQVKIKILEDAITDKPDSNDDIRGNKAIEFMVYNVLKKTDTETAATSAFLGQATATTIYPVGATVETPIARQDIEKVVFKDSFADLIDGTIPRIWTSTEGDKTWNPADTTRVTWTFKDNIQTVWDVSAKGDGSILAWITKQDDGTDSAAPYTVYVGSAYEIFANQNSSYLFSYLGYAETTSATATETIGSLNLLNTSSVTNMNHMFNHTGYRKMTSLILPNTFDTKNVTNMNAMFYKCGHELMESFDLGDMFDTSKVTDMNTMFYSLGLNNLKSLDLSSGTTAENTTQFNTSSVTDMESMFQYCGQKLMESLNLGNNFNTINVGTANDGSMKSMFKYCGQEKLKKLDLKAKFDTKNVTNMEGMFMQCGTNLMDEFIIGSKFDTSKVTNMASMFDNFGRYKLTTLDLGDNFDTSNVTNMSGMFYRTLGNNSDGAEVTLKLGGKFNTNKVTNMYRMFYGCGNATMKSLDLGDLFYTTSATNMEGMFLQCGTTAMTSLDLGPAFTKIATTNTDFVTDTGKSGACVIYAPESIYSSKNAFKLDTTSTTTIDYTRGTINLRYKTEWQKETTQVTIDAENTANSKIVITLRGKLTPTTPVTDYISDVTSLLPTGTLTGTNADLVKVFIDGTELTDVIKEVGTATQEEVEKVAATADTEAIKVKEVLQTITLSNFEESMRAAGLYKEWSGNISLQIARATLKDMYGSEFNASDEFTNIPGNGNMHALDTTGDWINIEVKDSELSSLNTTGKQFIDTIKPEFTYLSSEHTIGNGPTGDEIVKVVFYGADKYFASENLTVNELDIKIDGEAPEWKTRTEDTNGNGALDFGEDLDGDGVLDTELPNITLDSEDVTGTVNGVANTVIGKKYTLTIVNLDQGDGFDYSGLVTIGIPAGQLTDKSNNTNLQTYFAIGLDENDGNANTEEDVEGEGIVVDVTDPVWKVVSSDVNTGLITLRGQDKYLASNNLDEDKITVYTNGAVSDVIEKDVTLSKYINITEDAEGNEVITEVSSEDVAGGATYNGVEYTLQLSNITLESGGYVGFVPTGDTTGLVLDEDGKAYYRAENGGAIMIEVAAGTLTDESTNASNMQRFEVGTMDSTKPEIYDVQKLQNEDDQTVTFIFNVTDRNYDPDNLITTEELSFWIDGTQTDKLTIDSFTYKEINGSIDNTTRTLGHQYTLKLSGFVETLEEYVDSGRAFRELSGTLQVKILATAANDMNDNTLNTDTTTISQFVDFIKPDMSYKYTDSAQGSPGDIDYEGKTFTMVFEIVDKYFKESTLETELANATTDAEKQAVIESYLTIKIDGEVPDWSKVDKELTITDIKETFNKTVDGEIVTGQEHVIGKTFELKLSNLEQLQIVDGDKYLDYSGVITVEVKADTVTDTVGKGNVLTNITSGIDIPGGVVGDTELVDVVDPLWEKVSSSAYAVGQTATITIKGTDKFFASSNLTEENIKTYIKVFAVDTIVSGVRITDVTESVNITLDSSSDEKATVNGTENVVIGKQYTFTITGYAQDVNQLKIEIQPDTMLDTSGNGNKTTQFILYNVLRNTYIEQQPTNEFLGQSTATTLYPKDTEITAIARQDIEKVVFVDNLDDVIDGVIPRIWDSTEKTWTFKSGIQSVWDVSARGDDSILAWTSQTAAPYTVYVGSNDEIFANQDSRYLFSDIGNSTNSTATATATETIKDFRLVNTASVKDMSYMFDSTGYTAMTSLDLGSNFNTQNVEDMTYMFNNTGYTAMTSLDLGSNFNTQNVENMNSMFRNTGYTAMTNLYFGTTEGIETGVITLPDSFNTAKVTNMRSMFESFGRGTIINNADGTKTYIGIEKLNLGNSFDTSSVTNMRYMFSSCGYTAMTNLILPEVFDTSTVNTMYGMFQQCGYTSMTSLTLPEAFDTSSVTDMSYMFSGCGHSSMTSLMLPETFDTSSVENMTRMFQQCGYTSMTSLTLPASFNTSNVTDMTGMFLNCGYDAMTTLDLGPAFTKIASTNTLIFTGTGKEGACTIYAPESIYKNQNAFKLSSTDTTETPDALKYTRGTIIPRYKPEWVIDEDANGKQKVYIDTTAGTLTVTLRGSAYKTQTVQVETEGEDGTITTTEVEQPIYASNVTSTLEAGDIQVFINGVDVTSVTRPEKTLDPEDNQPVTETNATSGKTEITHTFVLSNFEQASRQAGIPYKEWSGNITLKVGGRGEATSTYNANILTDIYGNQSMMETDEGQVVGTWIDVDFKNDEKDKITAIDESIAIADITAETPVNMFVDFTKPEFTYKYAGTTRDETPGTEIDYANKKVTVVFDVTDRYFESTSLATDTNAELITVKISDYEDEVVNANINKSLTKTGQIVRIVNASTGAVTFEYKATDYVLQSNEIKVGERYELVLTEIQQTPNDGFEFSGYMSLLFDDEIVTDKTGNKNNAKTITIGIDEPGSGSSQLVDVVDPIIYYTASSIDRTANAVTLSVRADDKYLSEEKLRELVDNVIVKVVRPNGVTVTDRIVNADGQYVDNENSTITKTITRTVNQSTYMTFDIVISNFGEDEGVTSVIIPANVILDTSGNGNIETEIPVGSSSDPTAFKDSIVDFTKPVWEYTTSTINRDMANIDEDEALERTETGTVTIAVEGTDIYFDETYFTDATKQLDLSQVEVYIDEVLNTDVTKVFATNDDGSIKKESVTKTAANGDILKGVRYTLILGNFGANEGQVRIEVPQSAILDTSFNGNIKTPIDVGNPDWVETAGVTETDVNNPKYTGFRNDYVDYIKPVITYQYVADTNPLINRTDKSVSIIFNVTDTNFLESNIGLEDIQIFADVGDYEMNITETLTAKSAITLSNPPTAIENGLSYTLTLSQLELDNLIGSEIFKRHSGVIKLVIASDQVADSSGNMNNETTLIIDQGDGDGELNGILDSGEDLNGNGQLDSGEDEQGVIVDFIKPIIYYNSKYINWEDRYAQVTIRATDRFYDSSTKLQPSDLTLYELNDAGEYIQITDFAGKIEIATKELRGSDGNLLGYDHVIKFLDFEEEFKMKISIPGSKIKDTSGNWNEPEEIIVDLDNRRPSWKYVSTDTTKFESDGEITFNVKGVDKYLDLDASALEDGDLKLLKDGVDITEDVTIAITPGTVDETEKSEAYSIKITGLTGDFAEFATYSLVFIKDTLVDEFGNTSAAKTITFSKSAISSNTAAYVNVTYHISPDHETVHNSYVHELMNVNETGTNFGSTEYRPSTIGELHNDGENPLFAEPMYTPVFDGNNLTYNYAPQSFAGWAEADSDGNLIYYTDATLETVSTTPTSFTKVYGLYDDIPNTVTNLKAVWQGATVVFVSASAGDNSNDGKLPTTPVADIQTAYSKLSASGTAENNIIVIMDAVTYSYNETLAGNATITSLYAGVDYRKTASAALTVSADMNVSGDIIFDNIAISTDSKMLVTNYGDVTLGRRITTPSDKSTFDAVVGGNWLTETSTGDLGIHTVIVESGRYQMISAGSYCETSTETAKKVSHKVIIGNMKDAAISRNDKLTVGFGVTIGYGEQNCSPSTGNYADVILYSGTIGEPDEYGVLNLRSVAGETDGNITFKMYGGNVTGMILGGSRVGEESTDICNTMEFYGGELTGNIFGQGMSQTFVGSSKITLQGRFSMTGNIYGGSVSDAGETVTGTGNTNIFINSSSVTVNGNIYGGSWAADNSGYITGTTNITLRAGTVTGNIYGSGNGSGNSGGTNITIENGAVNGNIFGGAYNAQAEGTATIKVLGGTVHGNIYGGNENTAQTYMDNDTTLQNAEIIIGDTTLETKPTINGDIYGSGKYDNMGTVNIQLIKSENKVTVYGGSDTNASTTTANIYLKGMTVDYIYGGGNEAGTVTTANIYLTSGTATEVYGGGYKADVTYADTYLGEFDFDTMAATGGTATIGTIYGGPNAGGKVTETYVWLGSGNLTNVYGGGNSASVGNSCVMLLGITIDTIHGGSKVAGITDMAQVGLLTGTVNNVFGGGLDVGVTESYVVQAGATVTNIYGGNNSTESGTGGSTGTSNIEIYAGTVENVYGGNYLKGTTKNSYITIQNGTTVTGKLYGGGYKSNIGTADDPGSTSINIVGGTIECDINGGSEQGIVYGTTNLNIGNDAFDSNAATDDGAMPGNIEIKGNIYGAGDSDKAQYRDTARTSTQYNYNTVSVVGDTNIIIDNSTTSPITFSGSIYGAGNGATYSNTDGDTDTEDGSIIRIEDLGSAEDAYEIVSIERTGKLFIGNSFIELLGKQDVNNSNTKTSYTLNRITHALTIYESTTLYTQRGFNMVGGLNSYRAINAAGTGNPNEVEISGTTVNADVDNRLYTLEGINLIFAKEEGDIYATPQSDIWGEVNGMTFFGMYAINRENGEKQYDIYAPDENIYSSDYTGTLTEEFFANGTYVEGKHKTDHNIEKDGFYTNVAEYGDSITVKPQIIQVTDYGKYYDWIINEDVVNYADVLVGSTYGEDSIVEILLDHKYSNGATYTVDRVSLNALDTDVNLVDPLTIPLISSNANKTFGLTMETLRDGWLNSAVTNIYTADNGSFVPIDTEYISDVTSTPGTIRFKLHNSINITEQDDLGNVNITLVGKVPAGADGTPGNTFKVVIALNLQTRVDELKEQYNPSFTDSVATELSYTKDSRIDLSYLLYNVGYEESPYENGDEEDYYRVISTTAKLPTGTRITLKDYGQGDNSKVYYYHVTDSTPYTTETKDGVTRYIYKLSNFTEMGTASTKYADNNSLYYHSDGGYILEKYDISLDFIDAGITIADDIEKLTEQTYLELRNSTTVKYDNGDKTIKYNLYDNKNAIAYEDISNEDSLYSVVEDLSIDFTLEEAYLKEQTGILDTKYHNQIVGIGIQLVDDQGVRFKVPELQNFKLINKNTAEVYEADITGVIRIPMIEGFGTITGDYTLTMEQATVPPGIYTAQVMLYTADDGLYFGTVPEVIKEFEITFISKLSGSVGVEVDSDNSRIINKSTGLNLDGNTGIDMTVSIAEPTEDTNIRVELYKRQPTYTVTDGTATYSGTTYQLIDISDYLTGTWETPSTYGLTAASENEYMVYTGTFEAVATESEDETETESNIVTLEFIKALTEAVTTGEYKLVFKAYSDDTLVQTAKKTFIVTP